MHASGVLTVSEQPIQYQIQNLDKEGTIFDDSHDNRVDLHTNTVPDYDKKTVEIGRQMFEKSRKVEIEQPRLSEVAVRGIKLATLHNVRDRFKLVEQTEFFKDAA